MKFSVDGRQPFSVLKQTDEVKVVYKDKDRLMDFIEKIPDKDIVLEIAPEAEVNIDELLMYKEKFAGFCVAIHRLDQFMLYRDNEIDWYWPYPVTTYYELQHLFRFHPTYILLGAPLTFDLEKVKEIAPEDVKFRMIVNNAAPRYLVTSMDRINIDGSYVRPEDVETYGEYIDVMEFEVEYGNYKKEESLLNVYKAGTWPGNLNLLIDNLNVDVDNRAISEEFGPARITCGQRCMRKQTCRLCSNAILLADNVRSLHYELKKNNTN